MRLPSRSIVRLASALFLAAALPLTACNSPPAMDVVTPDVPCGTLCSSPYCSTEPGACYGSCCLIRIDAGFDVQQPDVPEGECNPACYPYQVCVQGRCLMREGGADAQDAVVDTGSASDAGIDASAGD